MPSPAPVPLHHRHFGKKENPPLVILHGLLGSSRNWQTVARELAEDFSVYALDLRNHGDSPHSEVMNYDALAGDVRAWLDRENLVTAHFLGHSMGGKTAMLLATRWPERVASLTVVDIAPKNYDSHHRTEFVAMNALNLAEISSRKDADIALEKHGVTDWAMRQFLLTNLAEDATGDGAREPSTPVYHWRINLPSLTLALPELVKNPLTPDACFDGATFFIRGGKSNFITDGDAVAIRHHFPKAEISCIPESGHNPHIDARENFVALLRHFTCELLRK